MGHAKNRSKRDSGRMAGGFVALPWAVLDSAAYAHLGHPARSLLVELARQLGPGNNGQLLASAAYLGRRGWKSNDVIHRALQELVAARLIHQTVQGHRPNKASWYAVTWQALAASNGYDTGAAEGFRRGAFMDGEALPTPKPTREQLYRKWDKQNASLTPPHGVEGASIAPSHGVEASSVAPSHGAIRAISGASPTPSHGDHLDIAICRRQMSGDSELTAKQRAARKRRNVQATEVMSAAC